MTLDIGCPIMDYIKLLLNLTEALSSIIYVTYGRNRHEEDIGNGSVSATHFNKMLTKLTYTLGHRLVIFFNVYQQFDIGFIWRMIRDKNHKQKVALSL